MLKEPGWLAAEPKPGEPHWTKRLRRGMGGAVCVGCADWEGPALDGFWCDTFEFPAGVAGIL